MNHQQEMTYGESSSHVAIDVSHVTLIGQRRDGNMLGANYLENGWRDSVTMEHL